jgi:uncharacterized ion transporter superfamily protein YfcC
MNKAAGRPRWKLPDAYVVILSIAFLAMVATWIIPAGEYSFQVNPQTKATQVDPNSFKLVPRHPVLPYEFFLYFPLGLEKAGEVVFLILLVGGFLQIINDSGAIEAGLSRLIGALGGRRMLIVPIIMICMSVLGFSGVLANAVVAFIPLGLLLARRLGLDPVSGVAIMYVGCYSGFAPSAMCPATTLIAQQIAGVPPMSGFLARTVVWLAVLLATLWYVMRYAARVRANPALSLHPTFDDELVEADRKAPAFTLRHVLTLFCLAAGFILFGWGATCRDWSLRHLSAVMMAVGIIGGLVGGMKLPAITTSFVSGCKHLLYSALIVGLAKSITLIMEDGRIIHTLVHYLAAPLSHLPPMIAAGGMYLMSLVIHFFITSGSGQAYVTMPIMSPIADIVGLSRQTAVSAYLYGDGFINIVIPTSGVLMSVIAMSKIPYFKWLKFALPLCAIWVLLGAAAIAFSTWFGW